VLGLHHSPSLAPCMLYDGVLYSVLALSYTISWPGLAADVTCMTSHTLYLLSLYVTHRHDIVNFPTPLSM